MSIVIYRKCHISIELLINNAYIEIIAQVIKWIPFYTCIIVNNNKRQYYAVYNA